MSDWTFAKNSNIEIKIDLSRPESTVYFRVIGDSEWEPTPFQSVNFRCGAGDETAALEAVDEWSAAY